MCDYTLFPCMYSHTVVALLTLLFLTSKWSFSVFQVQEQEEGLHQVQQEVAGRDRKETAVQGFCSDEEILLSDQGYCSLSGRPAGLRLNSKHNNCCLLPLQSDSAGLMIHHISPHLSSPPLQKGRGVRVIHLTTCNGKSQTTLATAPCL